MTGIELITAERLRQITAEGWTPEHDDEHGDGQLADAAMCYIGTTTNRYDGYSRMYREVPAAWPWDDKWWKPAPWPERIRNLVKAGALIAAEIDRIQREESATAR